MIWRKL